MGDMGEIDTIDGKGGLVGECGDGGHEKAEQRGSKDGDPAGAVAQGRVRRALSGIALRVGGGGLRRDGIARVEGGRVGGGLVDAEAAGEGDGGGEREGGEVGQVEDVLQRRVVVREQRGGAAGAEGTRSRRTRRGAERGTQWATKVRQLGEWGGRKLTSLAREAKSGVESSRRSLEKTSA